MLHHKASVFNYTLLCTIHTH